MKIAIDLSTFRLYQGTEVYAENLVAALVRLGGEHEYYIFKNKNMFESLEKLADSFPHVHIVSNHPHTKITSTLRLAYIQQFVLPRLYRKYKIDVIFSPSPFVSFFSRKPTVVVIHDAAYKRFKEFRSFLSKMYITFAIARAHRPHVHIVTVSQFSQQELVDLYGFSPKQITVASEGVPLLPKPDEEVFKKLLEKYNLGTGSEKPKYFLCVGSPRPRKNIEKMIAVFLMFVKTHPHYKLVIIGKYDTTFFDIAKTYKEHINRKEIVVTGFVTEREKASLYAHAQALIFASLYEGFGLPILEAQSVGVPVITSRAASMPEVAGTGALFVNPSIEQDIMNAMEKIADKHREVDTAVALGFENIKRFSWERAAAQTLDCITATYENSSR